MAWNKKGSTSGGASTGRDGVKRGGKDEVAKTNVKSVEFGECPTCNGAKVVVVDKVESDEDGQYTGTQERKCDRCGGTGRVKKK